jgi:hypothetical protein
MLNSAVTRFFPVSIIPPMLTFIRMLLLPGQTGEARKTSKKKALPEIGERRTEKSTFTSTFKVRAMA